MANVQRPQGGGAPAPGGGVRPGMQTIVLASRPPTASTVTAATGGVLRPQQFQTRMAPSSAGMRATRPIPVPTVAGGGNLVINNPGLAPGQPGSQITVPLQALQGLQPGQGIPTGHAGHLLVKTENNQYQILRVDTSAAPASTGPPTIPSTIRPTAALPTRPVSLATTAGAAPRSVMTTAAAPTVPSKPAPTPSGGAGGMGGQMTPDTAKVKCKNFLATLLRLAGEQPPNVANNVRDLIQGLIDGKVEPELFTTKLQRELSSSPQPCLVPFLKKSLPYLQHSLASGEMTIDGVRAPVVMGNRLQNPAVLQPGLATGIGTVRGVPMRPGSNVIYPTTVVRTPSVGQPRVGMTQFQNPATLGGKLTGTTATRVPASSSPMIQKPGMIRTPLQMVGKSPMPTTIQKIGQSPMTMKAMPGLGASPGTTITKMAPTNAITPHPYGTPVAKRPFNGPGGGTYSAAGDDDINDVAAMGGVNLAEESQRMASTSDLHQVLRSCKDETFLQTGLLHDRVARLCRERGLDQPPSEVINLVSHATQERLKTLLEKLAVIAEHRLDVVEATEEGDRYEGTQNVRGQLKFLNELEKIERKRHDEAERELLFRAAKSRTKSEDPEKEKLKAKAKELQRFEEEQLKHEKANSTAMLAIGGGPRKKFRPDETAASGMATLANRPRIKRVHLRDLLFLMEQEKSTKRSPLLWKSLCS